jgi:hypothetical protein
MPADQTHFEFDELLRAGVSIGCSPWAFQRTHSSREWRNI